MRKIVWLLLFIPLSLCAQQERFPVFDSCKGVAIDEMEACFYKELKTAFYKEFKAPPILEKENFKGTVNVIFLVNEEGNFGIVFVNSPYEELKQEVIRTFYTIPSVTPASYNNHDTEMQFVLPITFPLSDTTQPIKTVKKEPKKDLQKVVQKEITKETMFPEHYSQLNIPFVHQQYVDLEYALHKAKGTHTAAKPYIYNEMRPYIDLDAQKTAFLKPEKQTWVGKKFWNEHLLQVIEDDYWFNIDFLVDVQAGKDNSDAVKYTYNNSRIFRVNGGFGSKFSYSATIYENQARFADYINDFISNPSPTFKPAFSEGLIPGRGKAKGFGTNGYDYPLAEGYLSYTPNNHFQMQFGHGKNFIGDGYRSFILSDVAAPSTYLKIRANFWKFQYTNLWMWASDVRAPEVIVEEHARKYIAMHYLSINLSDRFTLGLFETAVSAGQNGMDLSYLNPVIFFRSIEFHRGEDAGNAIVGLTGKYKLNSQTQLYGQFIIDEFSVNNLSDFGFWQNKFAYQMGFKYFDAFKVKDLFLQGELNVARPYTFSHKFPLLNMGHYSQPLGHLWGANFWEAVGIVRYKKDRWSGSGSLILGKKGFDFQEDVSYGGNIYQSYEIRQDDNGNRIAQGNVATIFMASLQGNYLLNPANNLSLFAGLSYRKFSPQSPTVTFSNDTNIWFTFGVKADLFNWYFDF